MFEKHLFSTRVESDFRALQGRHLEDRNLRGFWHSRFLDVRYGLMSSALQRGNRPRQRVDPLFPRRATMPAALVHSRRSEPAISEGILPRESFPIERSALMHDGNF